VRGNLRILGKLLLRSFARIVSLSPSLPTISGVFATFSVFYDHASSQAAPHRLTHQQPKSEIDPVIEAKLRKLTEKTVKKLPNHPKLPRTLLGIVHK